MRRLRIAMAQINTTVGDFDGNVKKILGAVEHARTLEADIVTLPELAICGYPPEDLLLRPAFYPASAEALADLATQLKPFAGLHVLVGGPVVHLRGFA